MAQVHSDPEKVKEFAAHLVQFRQEVSDRLNRLGTHFQNLEPAWKDDVYRRFGESFAEALKRFQQGLLTVDQQLAFLQKIVQDLETYRRNG